MHETSIPVRGVVGGSDENWKSVSVKPSGTGCKYDFDVIVDRVERERPGKFNNWCVDMIMILSSTIELVSNINVRINK